MLLPGHDVLLVAGPALDVTEAKAVLEYRIRTEADIERLKQLSAGFIDGMEWDPLTEIVAVNSGHITPQRQRVLNVHLAALDGCVERCTAPSTLHLILPGPVSLYVADIIGEASPLLGAIYAWDIFDNGYNPYAQDLVDAARICNTETNPIGAGLIMRYVDLTARVYRATPVQD